MVPRPSMSLQMREKSNWPLTRSELARVLQHLSASLQDSQKQERLKRLKGRTLSGFILRRQLTSAWPTVSKRSISFGAHYAPPIHIPLIRVLVADDTRVHTELLADALKRDGCLQVTTSPLGSGGLTGRPNLHDVDVLLLGSNLDGQPGSGFEVLRGLQASQGDLRAVMLLDSSKRETILEAFRAGAKGVFSRHESAETLSKCVRRVHEGQIWANSQQLAILLQSLASAHHVRAVDARGMNLLSKRETGGGSQRGPGAYKS